MARTIWAELENYLTRITQQGKLVGYRAMAFGIIGFFVCLLIALLDLLLGMKFSAEILTGLSVAIAFILGLGLVGFGKYVTSAYVVVLNVFIVVLVFSEGLAGGSHLYFLSMMVAVSFLMGDPNESKNRAWGFFIVLICSFCVCVSLCDHTCAIQQISPGTYRVKYILNSIGSVFLIALFAYIGMYFERLAKEELINEKNKAVEHEKKISEQNKHLRDVAFTGAHIVRSPLSNIMSLVSLLSRQDLSEEKRAQVHSFLMDSSLELDGAIKKLVSRTNEIEDTN